MHCQFGISLLLPCTFYDGLMADNGHKYNNNILSIGHPLCSGLLNRKIEIDLISNPNRMVNISIWYWPYGSHLGRKELWNYQRTIQFPYIPLVNCNYAGHLFIFEHIIVSHTLLGSSPTLCDQGERLTFLSRAPVL
jgi:hypothetical protein